jgi:hypothetical protein
MADARVPHLQLVDARDDTRQFAELLNAMAGLPTRGSAPRPNALVVAAVTRLAGLMQQLEQRIAAIEAELVPLHRSRKCPCCHQLSLTVVSAQRHPEFGIEGIEQHDVRCGCGYQASRLYDPRDYIR